MSSNSELEPGGERLAPGGSAEGQSAGVSPIAGEPAPGSATDPRGAFLQERHEAFVPPIWQRLGSVWYRHFRVYTRNLISNGLPSFLEPLIFLVGIGLGLGQFIPQMEGVPYLQYLASGIIMTVAMFTSAFECSFGTYIRLEFDKAYDGMIGAPISADNLLVGEILWAGTKGFLFSLSVVIVVSIAGILPPLNIILAPFIGFVTGCMFAALGFLVTSIVSNINQFNFFFSGFISPMFFFSGVVFPVDRLPTALRPVTEILPLTHPVRIVRAMAMAEFQWILLLDALYLVAVTVGIGAWAVHRLKRKIIQ
jgi:lipooligosaccharide transport system permease protein